MIINAVAPFQGILHWVDKPREGSNPNTGNPWKSVSFALKYINHKMQEDFILFDMQGVEQVNNLLSLPLGTEIRVMWKPQCRSYTDQQGVIKYFGSCNAFSFRVGPFEQPQAQPAQQPVQQPVTGAYPQQGGYSQQPAYNPGYPQPAQPQYAAAPQQPVAPAPAPMPTNEDLPF